MANIKQLVSSFKTKEQGHKITVHSDMEKKYIREKAQIPMSLLKEAPQ